jgi:hypothetical protein
VVKIAFDFVNWLPVLRRSLKQTLDKKREGDFFVPFVMSWSIGLGCCAKEAHNYLKHMLHTSCSIVLMNPL